MTGAGKGNLENTGATKSSAVEGRVIGQVKFSISSILYFGFGVFSNEEGRNIGQVEYIIFSILYFEHSPGRRQKKFSISSILDFCILDLEYFPVRRGELLDKSPELK